MASGVLIKIPSSVPFSQVKSGQMSSSQELALIALPGVPTPSTSVAPVSPPSEATTQRVAQLEHNIRYLREQHQLMLSSLHKEVDTLRQRNRELQFQLVMSSASTTGPLALLQDASPSPEDDSRPKVVLSPRTPNLSPLQVEILEKDLAELRLNLKEERDKNEHLFGIMQEQQRRIELLQGAANKAASASRREARDAQSQAGASNSAELGRKLEESQRTIRNLRRENDDHRRELASIKANLSRSMQQGNGRQLGAGRAGGNYSNGEESVESQQENTRPPSSQHRFPPLQNSSYWPQQSQQPHRGSGMEFGGAPRSGHGNQLDKEAAVVGRSGGTTLPALRGNMYVFPQNNNNNNHNNQRRSSNGQHFYNNNSSGGGGGGGGGSRQGYYRGGSREEGGEGGRRYRGGRGQRERQLQ